MKYAVIADIHSNLEALTAVLDFLKKEQIEQYLCLGDIVGYGADPGECLKIIRDLPNCTVIAGNHDYGVADKTDLSAFNIYALKAVMWTREQLSEEELNYLDRLPLVENLDNITIVHSSLNKPKKWQYVKNLEEAYFSFFYLNKNICFIGHSHRPRIFSFRDGEYDEFIPQEFSVADQETKYIINVGSVGQPRDGIWQAACCIYDDKEQILKIKRIPYDVARTQQKIIKADLPEYLAARLKPKEDDESIQSDK